MFYSIKYSLSHFIGIQLNRIKEALSFTNPDDSLNQWGASQASDSSWYEMPKRSISIPTTIKLGIPYDLSLKNKQIITYESFSYDANGNITKLKRKGNNSSHYMMDNFAYNYLSGTNKLTSVDDQVSSGNYTIDIDDQSANNCKYDHIGNLTVDVAEGIDSIQWTVYGKIRSITRTDTAYEDLKKANLSFTYTPDGHRSTKGVTVYQKETEYTYYVRDAQGNVMAVYEMNNTKKLDSTQLTIENINVALIGTSGVEKFADFAIDVLAIHTETGMPDDYTDYVFGQGATGDVLLGFDPMNYIIYNSAIQTNVIANYSYTTQLQSLANHFSFTGFYNSIMPSVCADADILENLTGFMGVNTFLGEWDSQYSSTIAGMGDDYSTWLVANSYVAGPPVTCSNLSDVQNLVATQTTAIFCLYLAQATAFYSYYPSVFYTLGQSDILQQMAGGTNIGTIITATFPVNDLLTSLKENGLATFWGHIINEVSPQSDILDYYEYLGPDYIKQCVKVLPSFVDSYNAETESNYLQLIKGYYSTEQYATLMAALTELYYTPTQTLQLAEWHIYGSSRVGVYKANKPLALVADETITYYEYQTRVKHRYNGKKQYELSNHLGNVLVTISDRRTAVCNEVDSTLSYQAVVVTATDYYAFGSQLIGRTYEADTLSGYRFGFNGKEKTDEIYGDGNGVDFGARIEDTRLGRFMSGDPMFKKFPGETPYSVAGNSPVIFIDYKGKYKVLYIAFLPDQSGTALTLEQKNEIIQKAQQQLNENDIDITVVGIEVTQRIDVTLLNGSDNIVYVGNATTLKKEFGKDFTPGDKGYHPGGEGTQESWINYELFDLKIDPPIDSNDPNERNEDKKLAEKEGQKKDKEGWMAINIIHEFAHRWFKHASKNSYGESDPFDACNGETAPRENTMSCGTEMNQYATNFPMVKGTFKLFLKEHAQRIQNAFGKLSQAGWDKNKTRDNLTLKKEAKNVVKKI